MGEKVVEILKSEIEYLKAKIDIYDKDIINIQNKIFKLLEELSKKEYDLKMLEGEEI